MSGLVWYYDKLLTPFLQPYSLWNNNITGYIGACAKVNVVFTARRYALAPCLPLAGVYPCPPRSRIVGLSRWLKISSNMFFFRPTERHHSSFFFTPSADTQLQGEAVSLGAKYTGLEKFAIFD